MKTIKLYTCGIILSLSSTVFSQQLAINPADQFEQPNFSYVLECGQELISSMRFHRRQNGLSITGEHTTVIAAFEWIKERINQSPGVDDQQYAHLADFDIAISKLRHTQWRDNFEIITQHLGLPATMGNCKVLPLWISVSNATGNGSHTFIGKQELLQRMKPIDIILSLIKSDYRKSTSLLAWKLAPQGDFLLNHWISQVTQNPGMNIRTNHYLASQCYPAPLSIRCRQVDFGAIRSANETRYAPFITNETRFLRSLRPSSASIQIGNRLHIESIDFTESNVYEDSSYNRSRKVIGLQRSLKTQAPDNPIISNSYGNFNGMQDYLLANALFFGPTMIIEAGQAYPLAEHTAKFDVSGRVEHLRGNIIKKSTTTQNIPVVEYWPSNTSGNPSIMLIPEDNNNLYPWIKHQVNHSLGYNNLSIEEAQFNGPIMKSGGKAIGGILKRYRYYENSNRLSPCLNFPFASTSANVSGMFPHGSQGCRGPLEYREYDHSNRLNKIAPSGRQKTISSFFITETIEASLADRTFSFRGKQIKHINPLISISASTQNERIDCITFDQRNSTLTIRRDCQVHAIVVVEENQR